MTSRRTVLVPLAAGQTGRIAVINASDDDGQGVGTAVGANMDPRIADLFDYDLYSAGQRAVASLGLLPSPERRRWLLLSPKARRAKLSVATPDAFHGLSEENNRSAELGLALGLIMAGRERSVPTVLATGALSLGDGDNLATATVEPIGGIEQKCAAALKFLQSGRGGAWSDGIDFITPARALDGQAFSDAHGVALADLCEQAAKAGIEIRHRPIATLAEALPYLHLSPASAHRLEGVARSAAVLAACLVLASAAVLTWSSTPLAMHFAPITVGSEEIATPVRSVYQPDLDGSVSMPVCRSSDGLAQVAAGEELTFAIETDPTKAPLAALDFAVIVLGDTSEPKIFPMNALPREGRPALTDQGRIRLGARIPVIDQPDEEMKLIVLSQKLWRLPLDEIEGKLAAIRSDPETAEPINAAVRYLSRLGGGYLDYSFITRQSLADC
ncbi:MAG: hypothetical protein AAGB15_10900, partial [Pseudomonadota bacterium]